MSYPYPVEPTYPVSGWACGATSLYQRTVACFKGLSRGRRAYRGYLRESWLVCLLGRATALATVHPCGRVHSPCGASVYRRSFPTRHVRGQHGQPARSAVFGGCGPFRPISFVSKRPDSRNAKALAARVSSAGPTVASEGVKRDELGLRDYRPWDQHETRLYVPTVSGNDLGLSDERITVRLSLLVFARARKDNS